MTATWYRRYVFNNTYLMRKPHPSSPIFSEDWAAERVLEIVLVDYRLPEINLAQHYPCCTFEIYQDNGFNDWSLVFTANMFRLRLVDLREFDVDGIFHVCAYFYYESIRQFQNEYMYRIPPIPNLPRLLWRPNNIDFINIRHWHRRHAYADRSQNWLKEGF